MAPAAVPPMLTVHVRISDAATGHAAPCRVQLAGPDGTPYPPFGRAADFPTGPGEGVGGHVKLGRDRWAYVDGSFEVRLPAGVPLRVRAARGPEYRPLDETVTLGAGQLTLRLGLTRWSDVRAAGWVPGDSRCHFLTPHAALLEAAAEDLDVVNLLAARHEVGSFDGTTYPLAPELLAFSGRDPALAAGGRLVAVNTLNRHRVLGAVGLLHTHRPVFPLAFGPPDDTNDWSVCDWCDQCHRKRGLAVWVDPFAPAGGVVGGEALVAAVLGKVDAVELTPDAPAGGTLPRVYQLWTAGVPVPLVGGSGKRDNRTPLGGMRTYANVSAGPVSASPVPASPDLASPDRQVGESPPYTRWIEAVRAGRTFVTSGPLLTWAVDGTRVTASARSAVPFHRLEAVADGAVIGWADAATDPDTGRFAADLDVPAVGAGWVAVRTVPPAGAGFAHTSPVRLGESPGRAAAAAALRALVAGTRDWVEHADGFATEKARRHLLDLCDAAAARLGGGS